MTFAFWHACVRLSGPRQTSIFGVSLWGILEDLHRAFGWELISKNLMFTPSASSCIVCGQQECGRSGLIVDQLWNHFGRFLHRASYAACRRESQFRAPCARLVLSTVFLVMFLNKFEGMLALVFRWGKDSLGLQGLASVFPYV